MARYLLLTYRTLPKMPIRLIEPCHEYPGNDSGKIPSKRSSSSKKRNHRRKRQTKHFFYTDMYTDMDMLYWLPLGNADETKCSS